MAKIDAAFWVCPGRTPLARRRAGQKHRKSCVQLWTARLARPGAHYAAPEAGGSARRVGRRAHYEPSVARRAGSERKRASHSSIPSPKQKLPAKHKFCAIFRSILRSTFRLLHPIFDLLWISNKWPQDHLFVHFSLLREGFMDKFNENSRLINFTQKTLFLIVK